MNFQILHALRCVLAIYEASFHAGIQYIHTFKFPSSFSGFRKVRHEFSHQIRCALI